MEWEKIVEEKVKKIMKRNKTRMLSHDFDHVKRVQRYALLIAEKEGGDKEILSIAALLHDIVTQRNPGEGNLLPKGMHAKLCSEKAREILVKLGYPKDKLEKVCKIISEHEWSQNIERNLESQILYEADKLDSVGVFGALRHAYGIAEIGIPLIEGIRRRFKEIEKIRTTYRTKTGKELFESKVKPYLEVFKKALKEVEE